MPERTSDPAASAALLVAALLWSSAYVVMKWALGYFPPLTMIAGRMLAAGLVFLVAVPHFRRQVRYHRGDWKWFALMCLGEPCLYFIFETYALTYTTASQAGTISAILPVIVAVGALLTLKEKMSARSWLGAGLAIAGVIWLTVGAEATEQAPNPLFGNFLEVCAMLCAAVYFLCARRLSSRYSSLFITAVQSWSGAIFFLPAFFMPGQGLPEAVPLSAWLSLVYLGVAVSIGAYGTFNYGLSRLNAGNASIYVNLIPVFTLLMGVFFLGESLTGPQYPAIALVLYGLYISRR